MGFAQFRHKRNKNIVTANKSKSKAVLIALEIDENSGASCWLVKWDPRELYTDIMHDEDFKKVYEPVNEEAQVMWNE